jgi:PiT family inorganic phosphate transporter
MIDLTFFLFLSSGLFLGWSLGANDAANIFGTAVTTRMLRFRTAAILCAVFVVLGAVISGAGASHGLGKLGAVNALAGSFTVALSAALTVYTMTKWGLPVSTTQAVVGGIVGWNFFSDSPTDMASLSQIAGTWVASPILGALFAWLIYLGLIFLIDRVKPHILWLDHWTRVASRPGFGGGIWRL